MICQVAAYGEVDQRGGDVDRVDPLVGHRAHVTGPDLPDHPELALPGAGRHELSDPADLAVRARRPSRPDGAAGTGRCLPAPADPGPGRAAAAGPRTPAPPSSGTAICSLAATVPGGKPMSTATISPSPRGPSRKVGTCAASGAGRRERARRRGVGVAGGALDVAERARDLHGRGRTRPPVRSGPAAAAPAARSRPVMLTTAPVTV